MWGSSTAEESGGAGDVAFMSSGAAAADGSHLEASALDSFWGAEKAWQKAELEKTFLVAISEPQTVSGTFTSYTTYLITSTLCPEGVRRRYSDFDWIRDVLVARYHGIAVPRMPEKRLVGNQGKAFIEERMQGLEAFSLLVLSNPYLRNDATLRMFLTQKGAPEFEQAKKAVTQGVGADPSSNTGLARWFGVLQRLTLPVDADAACAELVVYCDELEVKLVGALGAVSKLYEAAKGMSDALASVKDAMADIHNSANKASTGLCDTLTPVRTSSGHLASRLKKTADAFSNAHDLSVFSPNEIQIFLLDGLVTEVHRVRGLKDLLLVRDAAQKAYSTAWVAQDKLQFQAKQFRDKGRADRADALEPKIAEAVQIMKRMKERLDDISKGVLHIEADRLARVRIERFVAMTGQYAALCIASGVRAQELWTSFLTSMELDQTGCVNDAQATLTNQMSMHTLDATGPAVTYVAPVSVLAGAPAIAVNSAGAAKADSGAAAGSSGAMFSGSSDASGYSATPAPRAVVTSTSGATGTETDL